MSMGTGTSGLYLLIFAAYIDWYGIHEAAITWLWTMMVVFHWWLLGALSIAVRDMRLCHNLHPAIAMINSYLFPLPSPVAVCGLIIYYLEFQATMDEKKRRIPESKYMHHQGFWMALLMLSLLSPEYRNAGSCLIWSCIYVAMGSGWYYMSIQDPAVEHHEITSVWQVINTLVLPVLIQVIVIGYALSTDFFSLD